ncbi:STAS domain-containing protein [Micromonospora parathelypteridis]|uniref:Anti-sigma factor antagonist n=1 Tax=Micromonospora parathelypteridis TaxID=1839617 RepID=A0A840VYC7_9ACTN|nr:STAS domain-containing protein [Micromonospora parathelypteridis]MBB5478884.1 anti-sigma B factor antagonist [Micromonospora parathelypteridis]
MRRTADAAAAHVDERSERISGTVGTARSVAELPVTPYRGGFVDFTLSTRQGRIGTVVEVAGDLDMSTTPELRDQLRKLVESGAQVVVVDLTGVGFMDSSGLGVLVVAYKDLRERNGRLALAGVSEPVRTVLSITSVDRVIGIFETVHDAEEASAAVS